MPLLYPKLIEKISLGYNPGYKQMRDAMELSESQRPLLIYQVFYLKGFLTNF